MTCGIVQGEFNLCFMAMGRCERGGEGPVVDRAALIRQAKRYDFTEHRRPLPADPEDRKQWPVGPAFLWESGTDGLGLEQVTGPLSICGEDFFNALERTRRAVEEGGHIWY